MISSTNNNSNDNNLKNSKRVVLKIKNFYKIKFRKKYKKWNFCSSKKIFNNIKEY